MKNILIFSGGTGSIALQNSIAKHYGDSVNVDIIISAYDNGKSTGECRKAFNSNILGPSDLRKNHLTQFKIQKQSNNSLRNLPFETILDFFEYRFDAKDYIDAYDIVNCRVNSIRSSRVISDDNMKMLQTLIHNFFLDDNGEFRSELKHLNFNDFSISNILYSSCAAMNNNSLAAAGKIMADFLGIKDNVHLISDTNLYLYAVTDNNYLITDESEIVDWSRCDDKIKEVKLLTKYGKEYIPVVDEDLPTPNKCENLIKNADIIIFSSGTQWSSLIPTYMHKNFKKYIKESKAAKYIIMNNVPDKDMFGVDAEKLLKIVNQYVDLSDFVGVFNYIAQDDMLLTPSIIESKILKTCIAANLSDNIGDKKHNDSIFKVIMMDYYEKYLNKEYFIFDFDDTLWSRNLNDETISINNLKLIDEYGFNCDIVSGNSINKFKDAAYIYKHKLNVDRFPSCLNNVMCNGGNSIYTNENNASFKFVKNILPEFNISNMLELIQFCIDVSQDLLIDIDISMFENRGNCILSIRPIKDNNIRQDFVKLLNERFESSEIFNSYVAYANGRTTIDIMQKSYTKGKIVNYIISEKDPNKCLYIGDEIVNGNDSSVKNETTIDYVHVNDVYDTFTLLKTISLYVK